ncbi:MAG: Lrp/AsnC family transcriptional regulator [Promethearchaeota archaeon]
MLAKNMGIDEIDEKIIEILQKEPNLTHTVIAKKVNRSQPTIGHRIKKLVDSGLLSYHAGLNLKNIDLCSAKVEIKTNNPEHVNNVINHCPHMIHALEISGQNNFEIIIISEQLKDLDKIVNYHFRNNPEIKKVKMEVILDIYNDLIIPISPFKDNCRCTM